jgi:hypothetical protein
VGDGNANDWRQNESEIGVARVRSDSQDCPASPEEASSFLRPADHARRVGVACLPAERPFNRTPAVERSCTPWAVVLLAATVDRMHSATVPNASAKPVTGQLGRAPKLARTYRPLRRSPSPCVFSLDVPLALIKNAKPRRPAMPSILPLLLIASTSLAAGAERETKPVGGGLAGVTCGCPGDFDHSGSIDGGDLATLLGGWSSSTTDLDGNGTTNAADLGILLGGWGICVSIPANDLCADALPITEGVTHFCTVGADTAGPAYTSLSGCIEFGYDSMASDIWYVYTAPDFGTLTVSTCGVGWDTRLAAYSNVLSEVAGCPTGGFDFNVIEACNDDAPGCNGGSSITFDVVAGKQYKIRVGGYIGWSGEGDLHIDFDPVGSTCATAIDLGFVDFLDLVGTTLDVDTGVDESPCALSDTYAKWYKVSPESCFGVPVLTVSTCAEFTDFDTTISVWKADPSGCIGDYVACNDDFASPSCQIDGFNRKSRLSFDAPNGTFYYVRVSGYNGARGNFHLLFSYDCD